MNEHLKPDKKASEKEAIAKNEAVSEKGSLALLALGYEGVELWRKLKREKGISKNAFISEFQLPDKSQENKDENV